MSTLAGVCLSELTSRGAEILRVGLLTDDDHRRMTREFLARYRKSLSEEPPPDRGELSKEEAQLDIEHFWAGALRRAVIDGDVENGSLMAGQSVGMVSREQPAAEIVSELVGQAAAALALRGGWRLHWEAERALAADRLALPGLIVPGYLGALALIRAGPLTPARFQKLEELSLLAQERREGFESARGAQLIYEAFSAAYARFGQEAGARSWIYKIDRLWPIYEKKIEVSPLEDFREGLVEGWVLEGDRPALSVRVGLFWIPPGGPASPGTLSASVLPDPGGRFRFAGLGAGQYYLGLMGPNRFPGRILGSPGVIRFSEAFPAVTLPPIRLLGARSLRPRPP